VEVVLLVKPALQPHALQLVPELDLQLLQLEQDLLLSALVLHVLPPPLLVKLIV
jgi:hypothetical protein